MGEKVVRKRLRQERIKRKILEDGRYRKTYLREIKEILEKEYGIIVSVQYLGQIERGEKEPGIKLAKAWTNIFGLKVEDCF